MEAASVLKTAGLVASRRNPDWDCRLKAQESGVVWSNQRNARPWWMWASKARASQRLTSGKYTDLLGLEEAGDGLWVRID